MNTIEKKMVEIDAWKVRRRDRIVGYLSSIVTIEYRSTRHVWSHPSFHGFNHFNYKSVSL